MWLGECYAQRAPADELARIAGLGDRKMSKIKLRRHHHLSDQERAAALDDLSAYLQDMKADVVIEGDQLTFSGRGYNGAVTISPGMAEGYISLGLLARPFKRQLEKAIHEHLEARLAAP